MFMKSAALFACVAFAAPAMAQSASEKTGVNSTLGVAPSTADFVKEAAMSDMFEIESSQLAEQRAGDKATKDFAAMMVVDHMKTTRELKAMIGEGVVKETPPKAVSSAQQSMLDKLKSEKGGDFAKLYHADQVSSHKDAASLFDRYASGGDNAALKAWAAKTAPVVRHHLEMAQALDK